MTIERNYHSFPAVSQLLEEGKTAETLIRSIIQAKMNDRGNYGECSVTRA